MGRAVGDVLPVAVAIAIAPGAIAIVMLLLLGEQGPRRATAFALGWMTVLALVTTAAYHIIETAAEVNADTEDGVNLMQLALGILLLGLAVHTWRTRPRPGQPARQPKVLDRLDQLGAPGAFGLGMLKGVGILKNVPLALSAGAQLAQSPASGGAAIAAIAGFVVLASSSVLAPVAVAAIGGDAARSQLVETKQWLLDNLTPLALTVLVLLASAMIGNGLGLIGSAR